MWATLTVLEELMQELDMLGKRRQTAGYGWWLMFSLEEAGWGGGGRGQEGRHGRWQWRAVDECGVVSIFADAGDEATVRTVGRGVFTLQARRLVIDGLLRALEAGGRRELEHRALKSTKRSRIPWCV